MALLFVGAINQNTVVPVMLAERAAYYREQFSNMYSASAFAVAYFLAEVPFQLLLVGS